MILKGRVTAEAVAIAGLLIPGALLRLWNLGNADFQGDEIAALYQPAPTQGMLAFLLDQRKGPLQYLTTYLVGLIDPGYTSEVLARLPFALAATCSMWFFYKFVRLHFGRRVALCATLFYASNGLLVGLSRVVQYQGLVMLFVAMALYYLSLATRDERYERRGLLIGFTCWALGVLAHYEALLILPFVLFLVLEHHRRFRSLRDFAVPVGMFVTTVLVAYLPLLASASNETVTYWRQRILGDGHSGSDSMSLFRIYNPVYTLPLYAALTTLGIAMLVSDSTKRRHGARNLFLVLWLAGVGILLELVVALPGTHIFNYLIPLTILMGLGVDSALRIVQAQAARRLGTIALGISGVFLLLQTYAIFVDGSGGYPWRSERWGVWTLPQAGRGDDLYGSVMGFPYDRGWMEIASLRRNQRHVRHFATNDKTPTARFYMRPTAWGLQQGGWYVWVHDPRSCRPDPPRGRITHWIKTHDPVFVIHRDGAVGAEIFDIPPRGVGSPAVG